MIFLLFVFFVGCAVRCDDGNYYVIQMPDEDLSRQIRKPLKVYWNVPTMQCRSKKIPFENLFEKFGIIQNEKDDFRGEKIAIMYDPGLFPALLKNETSGKFFFRNGGVLQEGNLDKHLSSFRNVVNQSVPDPNFSGIGIIDFESWRPVFRQNFGVLVPYKDVSYEIEKNRHWWWPESWIQAEAKERFEEAARLFMENTLSLAKQMRPNAQWGYYGFPYCFNVASNNLAERCANNVPAENDKTYWLWSESTALYPSVYSSQELTSSQLAQLVRGRVSEAARVSRNGTPILPYFWFRYRDGGFMSEIDLQTALQTFYKSEASGFIIWGSSNDVNTVDKCVKLLNYVEKIMGPAIAKYTKNNAKDEVLSDDEFIIDENQIIDITTIKPVMNITNENITTQNPLIVKNKDTVVITAVQKEPDDEFDWTPPENYTQDIQKYVEDELNKPRHNISKEESKTNTVLHNLNDSLLIDIILDALFNQNNDSEELNQAENKSDHDVLTTILVYKPLNEVTEGYDLETSTYIGNDVPLLKKNNNESSIVSSNNEDHTVTDKPETTTHIRTTENYEQSIIDEEYYDQFHSKNILLDIDDYIISDIDLELNTEEGNYGDITTEVFKHQKQITTEKLATTVAETNLKELETSTDLDVTTKTYYFKTRIPTSTNASAVINENNEDAIEIPANQVNGSASSSQSKYYFCIIFFYSVTKCLCDIYGQC